VRFRIVLAALFGVLILATACGESDERSERTAAVATPTPAATEAAAPGDSSSEPLTVIATIYPLGYFAERVGGDRAEVTVLVEPGVEAHGYEVTASELRTLGDADVIVMNGIGLEPWMERAIHAVEDEISAIVVEAADPALAMEGEVHMHDDEEGHHDDDEEGHHDDDEEGHHDEDEEGHHDEDEEGHHDEDEEGHHDEDEEGHHDDEEGHHDEDEEGHHDDEEGHHDEDEEGHHDDEEGHHHHGEGGLDPHFWLSPTMAARQVERIRDAFITADAANAAAYRQNADELMAELEELDQEFTESLGACTHEHFVTSHAAYGYLAAQYGLEQIALAGFSPEVDPSPQRLASVTDRVTDLGLGHVLVEPVLSDRLAQTVARETGIELRAIHAIESVTANELEAHGDYFGLMRDNLAALRLALECE